MSHQQEEIQALIAEIDSVLSKPSPRLPWVVAVATTQQRTLLEKVRSYLVSLERYLRAINRPMAQSAITTVSTDLPPGPDLAQQNQLMARQIWQALVQEMSQIKSDLTGPLEQEILSLQQEKQSLLREIQQLEARRQQNQSLAQQQSNQQQVISEFLQALTSRLQETLNQYVNQAIASLETSFLYNLVLSEGPNREVSRELGSGENRGSVPLVAPVVRPLLETTSEISLSQTAGDPTLLSPNQRLERLKTVQVQSDRLLMSLDATLNDMFETLQTNLNSYQESLSLGIEKMHNLGQQGEVMFTALVTHLTQQLEKVSVTPPSSKAPTLTSPAQPTASFTPKVSPRVEEWPTLDPEVQLVQQSLPYPGSELAPQGATILPRPEQVPPKQGPSPSISFVPEVSLTPEEKANELDDLAHNLFGEESIDDDLDDLTMEESATIKPDQIAINDLEEEIIPDDFYNLSADLTSADEDLSKNEALNLLESDRETSAKLPQTTSGQADSLVDEESMTIDNFLADEEDLKQLAANLVGENDSSGNLVVEIKPGKEEIKPRKQEIAKPQKQELAQKTSTKSANEELDKLTLEGLDDLSEYQPDFDPASSDFVKIESISSDPTPTLTIEFDETTLAELSSLFEDVIDDISEPTTPVSATPERSSDRNVPPAAGTSKTPAKSNASNKFNLDATDLTLGSLTDDSFEQASEDENLLPPSSISLDESDEINLDRVSLQQLQSDLFSLEGLEIPEENLDEGLSDDDPDDYQSLSDIPFQPMPVAPISTSNNLGSGTSNNNLGQPETELQVFDNIDDFLADVFPVAAENFDLSNNEAPKMTLDDMLASLMAAEPRG